MRRQDFPNTARFKPGNILTLDDVAEAGGAPARVQVYHDLQTGETHQLRIGADLFRVAPKPSGIDAPLYGPWQRLAP